MRRGALADPYVRTSRLSVCVQAAQAIGGGHDGVCGVERSPRPLRLHGAQAALAGNATTFKGSGSDRVKELANLDAEQSCNLGFE